ncbi:cupin-like domain-containing protein [Ascidiimonas sp. W6]|uniref:cupin-like domain-containing protein n=1 Tax=Ascidiimonas meishanensis TaxID=3128903 RepID=UPI0030EDE6B6
MKTIDTVKALSSNEFYNSYFDKKPVIVKGGIKETRFYKNWSMDYLKQKIGSKRVILNHAPSRLYNNAISEIKTMEGTFHEMADRLLHKKVDNGSYYLAQSSIGQNFPELLADLETPAHIKESDLLLATNMWLGGAGCDSGLHYDFNHNFFLQVIGQKELVLFSPQDSDYLYPSNKEGFQHMSQIALQNVDEKRFPLYAKAEPLSLVVEAGDMVYIPSYWWHNLISLELSLSINYWWVTFDIPSSPRAKMVSVPLLNQLVQGFLYKGCNIDHVTEDGELLLIKAVKEDFANIAKAMLLSGANVNSKSLKLIPGASALYTSVHYNQPQMTSLLLKFGAKDIPYEGKTATKLAEEKGADQLISLLQGKATI